MIKHLPTPFFFYLRKGGGGEKKGKKRKMKKVKDTQGRSWATICSQGPYQRSGEKK